MMLDVDSILSKKGKTSKNFNLNRVVSQFINQVLYLL